MLLKVDFHYTSVLQHENLLPKQSQLATQQLLPDKLQENVARITWPSVDADNKIQVLLWDLGKMFLYRANLTISLFRMFLYLCWSLLNKCYVMLCYVITSDLFRRYLNFGMFPTFANVFASVHIIFGLFSLYLWEKGKRSENGQKTF